MVKKMGRLPHYDEVREAFGLIDPSPLALACDPGLAARAKCESWLQVARRLKTTVPLVKKSFRLQGESEPQYHR